MNIVLKCECCEIYIPKNEEYRDGNLIYCLQCVQSKKMDDNLHEMYHIDWNYCEHCRNLILEEDFVGSCNIQINCRKINDRVKNGYYHLCKDCSTTRILDNKEKIVKCILEN
jgi:hypothetical protein